MTSPGNIIPEILIVNNETEECNPNCYESSTETTPLINYSDRFFDMSYTDDEFRYQSSSNIASTYYSETSIYAYSSADSVNSSIWKSFKSKGSPSATATSTVNSIKSLGARSSMLATLAEKICEERDASLFVTVCNILPLLQGTPIFAIPFAIVTGGMIFVPAALFLCIFADISSNLLIDCLYEKSPSNRVHMGIHDIASKCLGNFGGNAVYSFVILYMISHNVINVILFGDCFRILVSAFIPMNDLVTIVAFTIIFSLLLSVRKLSALAFLGFTSVISITIATITCLTVFIRHASHWSIMYKEIPMFNSSGLALSTAIFMYSLLANTILPDIECSMRNPKQMHAALHISYGVSSVFKLLFGALGAFTFGMRTYQLVAISVAEISSKAKFVIAILLLVCAFSNFSLPYFVLYEQLDQLFEDYVSAEYGVGGRFHKIWIVLSRVVGVTLTVIIGVKFPHFAFAAAIVGAVVGSGVVLIFPVLFHLRLKWNEMGRVRIVSEVVLLLLGTGIGLTAIYSSISALIMQLQKT